MEKNYRFSCGCEFPAELDNGKIVSMSFVPTINNVNFDCQRTWDLICAVNTVGIFQLDSFLGQKFAKRVGPRSLGQLAALLALIRPGAMEGKLEDGKSLTEHYIMRKNGEEPVEYLHKDLEPILKNTFGILTFQEQSIKIGQDIGGLTLTESDQYIRKGVGKKLAEVIAEGKKKFINGGLEKGYSKDILLEIFEWIEKSARYQFNACLHPSTVVETKEGLKILEDCQIGDFVLCPSDDFKDEEYVEVTNKFEQEAELYEIELEEGRTITCSMDHKFKCSNGKVEKLSYIVEHELEIYGV